MKTMMFLISIFVLSTSYAQKAKFAIAPGELSHLQLTFIQENGEKPKRYNTATGEEVKQNRSKYEVTHSNYEGYALLKSRTKLEFSSTRKNVLTISALFGKVEAVPGIPTKSQDFQIAADKSLKNSTLRTFLEVLKNPKTKRILFDKSGRDFDHGFVDSIDPRRIQVEIEIEGKVITVILEELLNRIDSQGWTHDCHIEDLFGFDFNQAKGF